MASRNALIIFIKNPVLGKVKTRLAKTVGDKSALSIYKELLEYTRSTVTLLEADRFLFYSDQIEKDDWSESKFNKSTQSGNDLGSRMSNAFDFVFKRMHEKVVIIGSDCIELKSHHIEEAFNLLDEVDVVVGPTLDGGYYLLGLKTNAPGLFKKINWSTDLVYAQTIRSIEHAGLTWKALERLSDIDNEDDWKRYLEQSNS